MASIIVLVGKVCLNLDGIERNIYDMSIRYYRPFTLGPTLIIEVEIINKGRQFSDLDVRLKNGENLIARSECILRTIKEKLWYKFK